jgi:hypothetical protein
MVTLLTLIMVVLASYLLAAVWYRLRRAGWGLVVVGARARGQRRELLLY